MEEYKGWKIPQKLHIFLKKKIKNITNLLTFEWVCDIIYILGFISYRHK